MSDGEHAEHVDTDEEGEVVREPRHGRSPYREVGRESVDEGTGMRPLASVLDGAVDRGQELQAEPLTLIVVPDGGGLQLGGRISVSETARVTLW